MKDNFCYKYCREKPPKRRPQPNELDTADKHYGVEEHADERHDVEGRAYKWCASLNRELINTAGGDGVQGCCRIQDASNRQDDRNNPHCAEHDVGPT